MMAISLSKKNSMKFQDETLIEKYQIWTKYQNDKGILNILSFSNAKMLINRIVKYYLNINRPCEINEKPLQFNEKTSPYDGMRNEI